MDEKGIMATTLPLDEKMSQDSRDQHTVVERDNSDTMSVRKEALGDDLPPGYFYSVGFLGALAVSYDQAHVNNNRWPPEY